MCMPYLPQFLLQLLLLSGSQCQCSLPLVRLHMQLLQVHIQLRFPLLLLVAVLLLQGRQDTKGTTCSSVQHNAATVKPP